MWFLVHTRVFSNTLQLRGGERTEKPDKSPEAESSSSSELFCWDENGKAKWTNRTVGIWHNWDPRQAEKMLCAGRGDSSSCAVPPPGTSLLGAPRTSKTKPPHLPDGGLGSRGTKEGHRGEKMAQPPLAAMPKAGTEHHCWLWWDVPRGGKSHGTASRQSPRQDQPHAGAVFQLPGETLHE